MLCLTTVLLFSSCGEAFAFVGTWVSEEGEDTPDNMPQQISFYSNKMLVIDKMRLYDTEYDEYYDGDDSSGTYHVESGKLIANLDWWDVAITFTYKFNGSRLTLTDGELTVTYKKQ